MILVVLRLHESKVMSDCLDHLMVLFLSRTVKV